MAKTTSTRNKSARGNSCLPTGKKGCAPLESVSRCLPVGADPGRTVHTPPPAPHPAYQKGTQFAHQFMEGFDPGELADGIAGFRLTLRNRLVDRETKLVRSTEEVAQALSALGDE